MTIQVIFPPFKKIPPTGVSQIIRILNRNFIGVQRSAGITAVWVRMNHRHLLIFRIHRIRKPDVKVKLMFFHILTSPIIVSLH